jgi:RNA polymerase sigma factor (sigma-70 family)
MKRCDTHVHKNQKETMMTPSKTIQNATIDNAHALATRERANAIRHYQRGRDQAGTSLYLAWLPIIIREARNAAPFSATREDHEDYVQIGFCAVCKMMSTIDPTRADREITYLVQTRIRGAIKEEISKQRPLSDRQQRAVRRLRRIAEQHQLDLNHDIETVAALASITPQVAREILAIDNVVHIPLQDSNIQIEDPTTRAADAESEQHDIGQAERAAFAAEAALLLPPGKQRSWLEHHRDTKPGDAARELGVTRGRISQFRAWFDSEHARVVTAREQDPTAPLELRTVNAFLKATA